MTRNPAAPFLALFAALAILLVVPPARARGQEAPRPAVETLVRSSRSARVPAPAQTAVTPERHRLTDEDFERDLALFAGWQRTLDSLAAAEPRPSVYHLATAQGLLNLARQQYERGDRCGAVTDLLTESARRIQRMRAGERDLPLGPPGILRASEVRPDLWGLAAELRGHAGFHCIEAQVARAETMILRAAHEAHEKQACDSARFAGEAQASLEDARAAAEACIARAAAPPASAAINPRTPERRAVLLREIELLPKYVRFEHDSTRVDVATALILDLIADRLTAYPEIRVRLSGHAVSRASIAYNLLVAKQRVESVRTYLLQADVTDDRLDVEHHATPMPLAPGETVDALARNHCVMLEYTVPGMDIFPAPREEVPQSEAPSPTRKRPGRNR